MKRPRLSFAGAMALLAASCGGGSSAPPPSTPGAPTGISYADPAPSFRVGQVASDAATVTGGTATDFDAVPDLPAGLSFHPTTGAIQGTPTTAAPTATYQVTASNADGDASTSISLQVTPALPSAITSLASGFQASLFRSGLAIPAKMAFAPDGRLFVNELHGAVGGNGTSTGNVRVLDAAGGTPTQPWASLTVLGNGEQGLLGLAIAPDFATTGNVYVYASTPADASHAARNRIVRFTESGGAGTNPTVIVDDLPIGNVHNAGDLKFGADGMLYATVGDTSVSALSQTNGSRAGRVLRYTPDGGVPADNPIASDPEWCRGLRNTFDMAIHPTTGGLFGSENGPTSQDEIEYLQKGKDYEWPGPAAGGGPAVGFRVWDWTPVIAPTGIAFYTGGGFGPAYEDNLFVCGYVDANVRRLVMSGAAYTDVDAEVPFLQFVATGFSNKPLDAAVGPDGALYVSTFDSIWKISKYP